MDTNTLDTIFVWIIAMDVWFFHIYSNIIISIDRVSIHEAYILSDHTNNDPRQKKKHTIDS